MLLRGVNDCANVMKRLVQGLLTMPRQALLPTTSATSPRASSHFRTSVAKGIEIAESLRGHTTGLAVPIYVIDATGGGGKTPVMPDYVISQAPGKVLLRNYEGIISRYTEPDDYEESACDCPDCSAARERLGVAGMYDRDEPTLGDVWAARLQKVIDRKNRMADIHGPAQI